MTRVEQGVRTPLTRLLDPRSIAVIGASADPAKRSYHVISALLRSDFTGQIVPVNPRGGAVLGLPVTRDIAELPYGLDVALVAVPRDAVAGVVRQLAGRGIAGAVVLANGFADAGAAGAALNAELKDAIAESGVRVVGPNTSGMIGVASGANLVGVPDIPLGPVALVAQSGNMLLTFLADLRMHRLPGLQSYIGLGNQIDVGYADCVRELAARPDVGAIALHVEGLKDGRSFLAAAAQASRVRPVVLLRGGRSAAGARAALSHSGSLAAPDGVARSVLAQAGIELVERSDELAIVAGALATAAPIAAGLGVAVLSDGGGHAALTADAFAARDVPLAALAGHTTAGLATLLGPTAAVANPIDVGGATDTHPEVFVDAARLLLADPAVGLVLIVGMYGAYHLRFDPRLQAIEDATSDRLVELSREYGKPLVVHSLYAAGPCSSHDILRAKGIPVVASIDHAVRAVAALHHRGEYLASATERSTFAVSVARAGSGAARVLAEPAARELIESAGIDAGEWVFAATAAEAAAAVARFGVPCAVKVVSPQIVHKSEAGGVRLNVTDGAEAFTAIVARVRAAVPGADITGVVVSPMAGPGIELLVGATADPIFGPVIAFGSGGVLVEAMRDVTFRAAPFTRLEAMEMIDETAASKLLDGYRGLPKIDRDRLAAFLVRIGDFVASMPRLRELDLNPVIASADVIFPVDVRIVLADDSTKEM